MFSGPSLPSGRLARRPALPATLASFVLRVSGWHQLWISILSISVFLLDAAPLEIQRRIVASAMKGAPYSPILALVALYVAVIVAFGLTKMATNIYRGWIGESATRALRLAVDRRLDGRLPHRPGDFPDAVAVSMVLAESDDVGGFVGSSVSIPVLEGGFLVTVFIYLTLLQPTMALVGVAVLAPQLIFVPLLQRAINRRVTKRITLLREVGFDILSAHTEPGASPESKKYDVVFKLNVGILKFKFSMNFLMNLAYSLGAAAVLGLGAWFVVEGTTDVATVVTFVAAIGKIADPWNNLVNWARDASTSTTKYALIRQGFDRLAAASPQVSPQTSGG